MGWGDFKKRVKKNIKNESKKVEKGIKKLGDHLEKAGAKLKGHIKKWLEDKKEDKANNSCSEEEKKAIKEALEKLKIIKDKTNQVETSEDVNSEIESISKILNDCLNNIYNNDECYEVVKYVNEAYQSLQSQCIGDTCINE